MTRDTIELLQALGICAIVLLAVVVIAEVMLGPVGWLVPV